MVNVQVRDVPDDVHSVLVRRAGQAGQSLQHYLLGELARMASQPTRAELIARIEARSRPDISVDEILAALDEGRAGR